MPGPARPGSGLLRGMLGGLVGAVLVGAGLVAAVVWPGPFRDGIIARLGPSGSDVSAEHAARIEALHAQLEARLTGPLTDQLALLHSRLEALEARPVADSASVDDALAGFEARLGSLAEALERVKALTRPDGGEPEALSGRLEVALDALRRDLDQLDRRVQAQEDQLARALPEEGEAEALRRAVILSVLASSLRAGAPFAEALGPAIESLEAQGVEGALLAARLRALAPHSETGVPGPARFHDLLETLIALPKAGPTPDRPQDRPQDQEERPVLPTTKEPIPEDAPATRGATDAVLSWLGGLVQLRRLAEEDAPGPEHVTDEARAMAEALAALERAVHRGDAAGIEREAARLHAVTGDPAAASRIAALGEAASQHQEARALALALSRKALALALSSRH